MLNNESIQRHPDRKFYINCSCDNQSCLVIFYTWTINNYNTNPYIHFSTNNHTRTNNYRENHSAINKRIHNIDLNNRDQFINNRSSICCSYDNYSCWDIFYTCTINKYNTNPSIHFSTNKHTRTNNCRDIHSAINKCIHNNKLNNRDQFINSKNYYISCSCDNQSCLVIFYTWTINNYNTNPYIHFSTNNHTRTNNYRENHSAINNYISCSYDNYSCWDIFYTCTINNYNTNLYIHFSTNNHTRTNNYREIHSAINK
ncbi:putative uncharacterized protein DDB_G0282499 [Heterodontus francisci]|uniref:putative uncharacterized protein DDB_G0282499 n=1 Tax=Heterodontus francisci TaxID=7792 RepID=UPI00355C88E1